MHILGKLSYHSHRKQFSEFLPPKLLVPFCETAGLNTSTSTFGRSNNIIVASDSQHVFS